LKPLPTGQSLRFTPLAADDLRRVRDAVLEVRPLGAAQFLKMFRHFLMRLAAERGAGQEAGKDRDLRKTEYEGYLIFHRTGPHGVEVIRVLGKERDI
jgi:plasmid stabilization system protein ParE